MKKIFLFTFAFLCTSLLMAQNPGKGFKALEADDFATAKHIFSSLLEEDASNIVAHFGMSRYYGSNGNAEKNKEKALEHLEKAEAGFPYDNAKEQGKYAKYGVSVLGLETRRDRIEKSILEDVKKENTVAAFEEFLKRFPESAAALSATNYRNKVAYKNALTENTVAALDDFVTKYPEADEIKKAVPMRNKMAAEVALKAHTEEGYLHFLEHYGDASQAPQMEQRLNAVAFENAKAAGTAAAFEKYIQNYPESVFITQAKEKLDWLRSKEGN